MTPAQLEHLKLIDAHLERLLEIASKRTPGEWHIGSPAKYGTYNANRVNAGEDSICEVYGIPLHSSLEEVKEEPRWQKGLSNAAFITAEAGNAEAGWRATRSIIDYLLMMHKHGEGHRYIGLTEDILTAFPPELIQKP